jgi:hypothetical protein
MATFQTQGKFYLTILVDDLGVVHVTKKMFVCHVWVLS